MTRCAPDGSPTSKSAAAASSPASTCRTSSPEAPHDPRHHSAAVAARTSPPAQETPDMRTPPMHCPECGEDAVNHSPSDLVPWEAHGMTRPAWSHKDGSSLCPVPGPAGGYQPAQPQHRNPDHGPARLAPPAATAFDARDPGDRAGALYDSEGQLIEGLVRPPVQARPDHQPAVRGGGISGRYMKAA